MEALREDLQKMKVALEEERSEKEEVQGELDRTSQRVKEMLISMEGVEHGKCPVQNSFMFIKFGKLLLLLYCYF